MIGFVVGAAAIAGFVAYKRYKLRHYMMAGGCGPAAWGPWHGHHHGHGGHGGHHGHHHRRGFGGWRQRGMEYWLLAELDCTPAQEKLVREELRGIIDHIRGLREEREATREDLGRAIVGDQLDRTALLAMFSRHDQRLVELRANITASLERVHGTLDPHQRERLAAMVRGGMAGGTRGPGPFGPYR